MKTVVTGFALTLSLMAVVAAAAPSQQVVRRVEEPTPIDATDPLALRAAALVKLVLAGNQEAAAALLRKEAGDAYAKGGTLDADVATQIKRLAGGKYTIGEFEKGYGADVLVHLKNDNGEDTNIVVRYNGDKRMTGFAEAKIRRD